MTGRRSTLVFGALTLAACAPSANTEDNDANTLIDLVVSREAPFHRCVEITSAVGLVEEYPSDPLRPQTGILVAKLKDVRAVDAARKIAIPFEQAMQMEAESRTIQLVGEADNGGCAMSVQFPLFSGDFAFVDFHSPSGDIGSYVFERRGSAWRVNERLHFGWW